MSNEVESLAKDSQGAAPGDSAAERWLELCLLLSFAFSGYFLNSLYMHRHGHSIVHFGSKEILSFGIFQEGISLALVWYLLSRRKLQWKDIGLRWSVRDLFSGTVVAAASYGAYWATYHLLIVIHNAYFSSLRFTAEQTAPYGRPPLISVLFCLLNPFFEELIVRAYLMTEVQALTGSWMLAVGISTVLQASYHTYLGWPVAISYAIGFLVFSIYYAHQRRVTPLILAHGFFDTYWIVLGLI
jgi:membrane protease YdiL (CAAX protease family)